LLKPDPDVDASPSLVDESQEVLKKTFGVLTELLTAAASRSARRAAEPDFEQLLHVLEGIATCERSWRDSTAPSNRSFSALFCQARAGLEPLFTNYRASGASHVLLTRLYATFCGHPTDPGGEQWRRYGAFWTELQREFDLDVATTNYDDLLGQALPSLTHGFVPIPGERAHRFDPRELRGATHRLAHLHGSVHLGAREWDADANRFAYEDDRNDLYWYEDVADARHAFKAHAPPSQAREDTVLGPLITGLHKPAKVLAVEPYATYYRSFGRWVEESPRLLVIGYGFGDLHINEILNRVLSWHGDSRRVALVTFLDEAKLVSVRHSHTRTGEVDAVLRWARVRGAWYDLMKGYEDPWAPNGCCRVYPRGFDQTIQDHARDVIAFLRR
jgi:hypothetical protein